MSEHLKIPETYNEAIRSDKAENWINTMKTEMSSLNINETWTLVDPPKDSRILSNKWVFRIKQNPDRTINKYKAKGFNQEKGVNYEETFSPVAKMSTIRSILSLAAHKNMKLAQFDISTTFIYGNLNEDEHIYIYDPTTRVS